jgi:hypothetical protein
MDKPKASTVDKPKSGWGGRRLPPPLELGLTLLAIAVLVAAAILSVFGIAGSSVLAIAGILAAILAITRYWVETVRVKRTTVEK